MKFSDNNWYIDILFQFNRSLNSSMKSSDKFCFLDISTQNTSSLNSRIKSSDNVCHLEILGQWTRCLNSRMKSSDNTCDSEILFHLTSFLNSRINSSDKPWTLDMYSQFQLFLKFWMACFVRTPHSMEGHQKGEIWRLRSSLHCGVIVPLLSVLNGMKPFDWHLID